MNAAPEMDPAELRHMLAAARRLRAARAGLIRRQIARLRAELAVIRREEDQLRIAAWQQRCNLDPRCPFTAARIAASIANLLPPHSAIDAVLADRAAERAEHAARAVLQFPSPHLAPNNLEASP